MPSPEGLSGGILGAIDKIVSWAVVVGLGLMALVIFVQVAARYALNSPTVWSEELAISMFVWVTMLAIPLGLRRGEHLTLDFITKRFSGGIAKGIAIGIAALNVLMFAVLIVLTINLLPAADRQLLAGISGGFGIPAKVSWVYAAVIVGGALSVVFSIERAVLFTMGRITTLFEDPDQLLIEELEHELAADSSGTRDPGGPGDASAPNRSKED
ncbi:TRAP transporter small permease [Agrococcus jenensis]|uniref:TRAP-type C4-dicarboxylate transport system permease small subunit n=1 Tax=Agrococcus jenensis TaxID=46353 RepID=A0A3N2ARY7_9MICO|nr:TRAP transporter small permease [Agrococcus jenensis]ROR65774.1 TRAP-type C4-dicarboxylate transport system permease small subunit [Agrococcus jenensis]